MWYQPIEFPDGTSKRTNDLDKDSFGKREWDKVIKPNLPEGKSFLDIGCNAGIHLVLADFEKKYGIERHPEYLEQCKYVLDKFGVKAELIYGDVLLGIEIPEVDVTLMSKTLHWVGYSDDGEFIDNYEQRVNGFLENLKQRTGWLVCVGVEGLGERIGGSFDRTLPYLEMYFKIVKIERFDLDRRLNLFVCRGK